MRHPKNNMSPKTNLLIKTSFYFLLSASLLAGPMWQEANSRANDKATYEQKVAELEASQRARTALIHEDAPSSAQDEERDGSAIARLSEAPVGTPEFAGQVIHQRARNGAMNIGSEFSSSLLEQQSAGIGSASAAEVAAHETSVDNNNVARLGAHEIASAVTSPLHNSLLIAQENAFRLLPSPSTAGAEMRYVDQEKNSSALDAAAASSELAVPHLQETVPATQKEKIEEKIRITSVQIALINSKAIEAEESGKPELTARYRGVAAKQEEALALFMQSVQAEAQGKDTQGCYLNNAGFSTKLSGDSQMKAIEAEESGKPELAACYRGVAAKQEEAVGLYMQAAQADAQGKVGQRMNLGNAGYYTSFNATAQLKVIEAEESGKPELAACYRGVAAKQEKAVALSMQAVQAEAQGKDTQGRYLNRAGISTKLSGEAQLKAIEAEESGKSALAGRYRGVAAKQEEAVALFMQAVQAEAQGKDTQGVCLNNAGIFTKLSGEAQIKAIEAIENQKLTLARSYEGVAKIYQEAATLAHSASLLENKTESQKLKKTATDRAQIAKNQLDELERS